MKQHLISISAALVFSLLALPAAAQVSVGATANVSASANTGPGAVHPVPAMRLVASSSASTTMHMNGQDRTQNLEDTGKAAIDKRIQSLQDLSSRIGQMGRLSADEVSSLQASISTEVDTLTSLETTIAGDTSTTSLKADVTSITKAYRVYLLVIPQAEIASTADRLLATAGQLANLSVKLSTRIDSAASAGADVSSLQAALSDLNAKVADAQTQANAAVSETVNLQPDNGDASVQASNTAALKDARTKLDTARQDLQDAYKDAQTIVAGVKGKGPASATTSADVNAQ